MNHVPQGDPKKTQDMPERLCQEYHGIPLEEMEEMSGTREVWTARLRLLPPQPEEDETKQM